MDVYVLILSTYDSQTLRKERFGGGARHEIKNRVPVPGQYFEFSSQFFSEKCATRIQIMSIFYIFLI